MSGVFTKATLANCNKTISRFLQNALVFFASSEIDMISGKIAF